MGNRQNNRYQGKNVKQVNYLADEIKAGIDFQVEHGKYEQDNYFYQLNTSEKIINILENINLYTQKSFYDKK